MISFGESNPIYQVEMQILNNVNSVSGEVKEPEELLKVWRMIVSENEAEKDLVSEQHRAQWERFRSEIDKNLERLDQLQGEERFEAILKALRPLVMCLGFSETYEQYPQSYEGFEGRKYEGFFHSALKMNASD